MTILESAAGTTGGAAGSVIGYITFVGTVECVFFAMIGATTGFFTVRLLTYILDKYYKNRNKKYIKK